MSFLKTFGRAILALIVGYLLFQFWVITRPNDPEYYSYLVGFIGAIIIFIMMHYIGKES